MASCSTPTTLNPLASLNFRPELSIKPTLAPKLITKSMETKKFSRNGRFFLQCSRFSAAALASETESDYEAKSLHTSSEEFTDEEEGPPPNGQTPPPVKQRRRRYRKQYPGEAKGISEEMRFVTMKLRNKGRSKRGNDVEEGESGGSGDTWHPSVEGFCKYLVDSKLVFGTVERIVDESTDVSYVYFRRTGLERSDCISRDLEWLSEQGNEIPEPSNAGLTYVRYLEELAGKSPPLFLCHFYNIYFSHIAGGQVIARKVSDVLFGGRELEMYSWEGDAEELLQGVREKLNALGEVVPNLLTSPISSSSSSSSSSSDNELRCSTGRETRRTDA